MLLSVQLLQIARAKTTYESLDPSTHYPSSGVAKTFTAAVTAGTTSLEDAELTATDMGPNLPPLAEYPPRASAEGCITQWKRILGLDTFFATAFGRRTSASRPRNPFSRGVVVNCKDFWCDGTPIFGARATGVTSLDRQPVNYTALYETPPRMRPHSSAASRQDGSGYEPVAAEDTV